VNHDPYLDRIEEEERRKYARPIGYEGLPLAAQEWAAGLNPLQKLALGIGSGSDEVLHRTLRYFSGGRLADPRFEARRAALEGAGMLGKVPSWIMRGLPWALPLRGPGMLR